MLFRNDEASLQLDIVNYEFPYADPGSEDSQWLVLTSPSGVKIFFDLLRAARKDVRSLAHLKVAALGAGTVRAGILRVKENGREALRQAVRELSDFRWIVFTSRNGIRFFFEAMRRERIDFRCLSDIRFAAVGRGTADFLEGYGFAADYMPERFFLKKIVKSTNLYIKSCDMLLLYQFF